MMMGFTNVVLLPYQMGQSPLKTFDFTSFSRNRLEAHCQIMLTDLIQPLKCQMKFTLIVLLKAHQSHSLNGSKMESPCR